MPKVCNLCISLVWLCHHKIVMMLQKQHIPFWNGDQIAILCTFLSQNDLRTLFVAKNDLCTFLSRKQFTHFVWKVFARWILPSGKFRLFGPLNAALMMIITTTLVVQYHHHYYDQRDHSYKQYHDEHHHHRPCCAIPSSGSPLPFIGTHWTVGIVLSPTPAMHQYDGGRMMQRKYRLWKSNNQNRKQC